VGPTAALLACLLAAASLAACGTGEREADAAAVVERFHAALAAGDGVAACAELSEQTASTLEEQGGRPCAEAVLALELPAGATVAETRVEAVSAFALLDGGGAHFLDEGPGGWKITAAACEPTLPDLPYDCTLEG
jgi:hypothetical protein